MVVNGSLSLGDFVAFNLFLALLVVPLRSLGMWIGQAQRATASGERIFQVIDEPEDIRDAPDARELAAGPGRITLDHVTFGYDPARPVLRNVDLELAPGKVVALIGHTGAGKTSLAALIPRFYDVQDGSVSVDGQRRARLTLASLRRAIGVISQDPFLFSRPCARTSRSAPATCRRRRRARRARRAGARVHRAAAAGLRHRDRRARDHALRRPAPAARDRPRARVDPRILILDDATASVDATTEALIRVGLRERDARPDDAHHRAPALDDRARRRDRRPRRGRDRRARHARGADRDERGLPRDLRARALLERQFADAVEARAAIEEVACEGLPAGSHLTRGARRARSDWSWRDAAAVPTLGGLVAPYRGARSSRC
jgi:ABC-type ATPase involved in cell division